MALFHVLTVSNQLAQPPQSAPYIILLHTIAENVGLALEQIQNRKHKLDLQPQHQDTQCPAGKSPAK
jgi:GAF domain-containing protein